MCWLLAVLGQSMWQWLFGPDVQHKECIKEKKTLEVGIRAHSEGREGRVVKCWLKRGENQSSKPVWLTACQGVFCGGVKNSTIALPRPPSLSVLPPPHLCLIHHLPPHPSSHCRLLLNVSPSSASISDFSGHCSFSSTTSRATSHFLS